MNDIVHKFDVSDKYQLKINMTLKANFVAIKQYLLSSVKKIYS